MPLYQISLKHISKNENLWKIEYYSEKYGSQSQPQIPKSNNFVATSSNLQAYFLMQALPQAVANLRMANGTF